MTTDSIDKIKKGIEPHAHDQQVLLRLMRKHNPLTAAKFDEIFGEYANTVDPEGNTIRTMKKPRMRVKSYAPGAFILGSPSQGRWSEWLHLLALMIYVGLAEQKERPVRAYYLTDEGQHAIKEPVSK